MKSFTEYLKENSKLNNIIERQVFVNDEELKKEYSEYTESGDIILDESIGGTLNDDEKCLRFDEFMKQKLKRE